MIDSDLADMFLCSNETQDVIRPPSTECPAAAGAAADAGSRASGPRDRAPGLGGEPTPALWQGGVPMPAGGAAWPVRVSDGGPGGWGQSAAVCADRAGGDRA